MNRTPPNPPPIHTHALTAHFIRGLLYIAMPLLQRGGLDFGTIVFWCSIKLELGSKGRISMAIYHVRLYQLGHFSFFFLLFLVREEERERAHRRRVRVRRTQWGKKIKRMKKKRRIYCGIECVHLWLSVWQLCLGKRVDIRFLHFGTILFSLLQLKWKRQPKLSNLGPEKCFLWT